jgi:hypothetical protein
MTASAPPSTAHSAAKARLGLAALLAALCALGLLPSCGGGSGGPAPAPVISSFGPARSLITAGASTPLTAVYSGGTGQVDHGVGALPSDSSIPVSPAWDTTYTLTVTNATGQTAARSAVIQVVAPPQTPVISAPPSLLAGQTGVLASVAAQEGCTFAWTIQGGTFTSQTSGSSVTFRAGAGGAVILECTATNAAGTATDPSRVSIPISTAPALPVLSAPAIVTANLPGNVASALPQAGCTLAWTISGGTFDSGASGDSVAFTAAPGGTVVLGCRAVSGTGVSSPTALITCLIAPAPLRPVISAPAVASAGASGLTAAVVPQVGCALSWSILGGTLDAGQGTHRITFSAGDTGTVVLTCVATNIAGTPSPQGTALIPIVLLPDTPVIAAPTNVTAAQPGYTASVPPQPGCTYAWSIAGGNITAGAGTNGVTFTPGPSGTVSLGCVVTNAAGHAAPPGTALCAILPFPATPVISAPLTVNLGATGLLASVPNQVGCTFTWTISGGSITSGADTTGITFTAAVMGTLNLTCVATNAAGTSSAPGAAHVSVISTPVSTITAPSLVTGGMPGYLATVPLQSGCTYSWTISGGTITGGAGTANITFTPAATGEVTLGCVVTNAVGTSSPPGTATCPIAPQPAIPVITAPSHATANQGGYPASVAIQAGCTYAWSITGGAITSGGGTAAITFTPGAAGLLTLDCVVINAAGTPSLPGTASVTVTDPPVSAVVAPTSVTAGQAGYTASVGAQAGCAYAWSITGGSITAGAGTISITFTPDPTGTVNLSCVVTNAAGTPSLPGTAVCIIVPAPLVPVLTAPGSATANQAGYSANVPAQTGATFAWSITGGTITTGNGTPSITFSAGPVGTLNLSCVATNSAGTPSSAGSGSVNVISGPVAAVTAPASVTSGQTGYGASVPAQAGSTYAWTITNGAIITGTTSNLITFTAGATGTTDLSCVVTNAAGTPSLPGTAACAIVPPPPVAVISAPSDVTANQVGYSASATVQAGCSYAWTVTNGTLTAGNGTSTITFAAGGAGAVALACTITNSAGTASAPGASNCNVHPIPIAPVTAPAFVTANQSGYLASVPTQGGCTYAWSAVGGSITAGANTSMITFTPGASGAVNLSCVVTNLAGTPSTPGSSACTIVAAPSIPVLTAPAFATAITPGYTASTPSQPGCSFGWTVLGGTLTSGNGSNAITFTPGTAGIVEISCIASNGAGSGSAPGTASVTIVPLPAISAFTASPTLITHGDSSILAWSVTGASSLAIDQGVGDVSAQVSKNVFPTANTTYTLTATNLAGSSTAAQASVSVVAAPTITSFTASPTNIGYAGVSTLTGVFSGGTGTIDHGIGSVSNGMTVPTAVLFVSTTYTLTVVNTAGTFVTATATVTVPPAPAPGSYTATGTAGAKRVFASGTALQDTTVLLAGGSTDLVNGMPSAEIYNPATGNFSPTTGAMAQGRFFHTATLLPSGKVLFLGGIVTFPSAPAGAEIYDPATGLFTPTLNPPLAARVYHTATLLQNGKVLIAGGTSDFAGALASAEIFDPAPETFTATGPMGTARRQATATLLVDGRVLLAGGSPNGAGSLNTAELYDPTAGLFTPTTGAMAGGRFGHSANLLPGGAVLVAGGSESFSTYLKTAEIFNPVAKTFSPTTGTMADLRYWHAATSLVGGSVLITGGTGIPDSASAEVYDLATGLFKATIPMLDGRYGHIGAPIPGAKVLLSTGQTVSGTASSEIFQ